MPTNEEMAEAAKKYSLEGFLRRHPFSVKAVSLSELETECRAFEQWEPRDSMYRVSTFLVGEWWGNPAKLVDALSVLLLIWNGAFYRYGSFDETLNRSPSRLKFSEALLGVHSTFDGSMILFQNVIQVLHRSVSTAVAQRPLLFSVGDRGAVNRCQVSVDHSRLGMGSIAERLAKQPLGSIGIPQR
jgi:hypothetical protein